MALRYWVGGTGFWNDAANHWSDSSGGIPNVAFIPGSLDQCFIEAGGDVTVESDIVILLIDVAIGATITLSDAFPRTIYLQDSFTGNGTVHLDKATIRLEGANSSFTINPGATLTAGTSDIRFTYSAGPGTLTFSGGGKTYNRVGFYNPDGSTVYLLSSNTFQSFSMVGAFLVRVEDGTVQSATNWRLSGRLAGMTMQSVNAISPYTFVKLGGGTVAADAITSMTTCVASPTNTFYAGTGSVDGGGNTNWIFTASPDQRYWVGESGNWSDAANHWAAAPGSIPGIANLPTTLTDAYIEENSVLPGTFTAQVDVVIDAPAFCRSFDVTAPSFVSGTTCIFRVGGSAAWNISGDYIISTTPFGFESTYAGPITFSATTPGHVIQLAGSSMFAYFSAPATVGSLTFDGVGGEWSFADNATTLYGGFVQTSGLTVSVVNGTLNTNDNTVKSTHLVLTGGTFNLGATVWTLTGASGPSAGILAVPTGSTTVIGAHTGHILFTANTGASWEINVAGSTSDNALNVWLADGVFGQYRIHGTVADFVVVGAAPGWAASASALGDGQPTIAGDFSIPADFSFAGWQAINKPIKFAPPAGTIKTITTNGATLGASFSNCGIEIIGPTNSVTKVLGAIFSPQIYLHRGNLDPNGFAITATIWYGILADIPPGRTRLWAFDMVNTSTTITYDLNVGSIYEFEFTIGTVQSYPRTSYDFTGCAETWYEATPPLITGTLTFGSAMGTNIAGRGIMLSPTVDGVYDINGNGATISCNLSFAPLEKMTISWRIMGDLTTTGYVLFDHGVIDTNGFAFGALGFNSRTGDIPPLYGSGTAIRSSVNGVREIWMFGTIRNFAPSGVGNLWAVKGKPNVHSSLPSSRVEGFLDFTNFTGDFVYDAGYIEITGDLTLNPSMSWTANGPRMWIYPQPLTAPATVTSNGAVFGPVGWSELKIGSAFGDVNLADDLVLGNNNPTDWGSLIVTVGANFDTNGHNIDCRDLFFDGAVGTVNLGASVITLRDEGWTFDGPTSGTLNAGTSTIQLVGDRLIPGDYKEFDGNGATYYRVVFDGLVAQDNSGNLLWNGFTCDTLEVIGTPNMLSIRRNADVVATNFLINGTPGNLMSLVCDNPLGGFPGSTITKAGGGYATLGYMSIQGMTGAPDNTWFAGHTSTDAGLNFNIVFGDVFPLSSADTLTLTDVTAGYQVFSAIESDTLTLSDVVDAVRLGPLPPGTATYPYGIVVDFLYGAGVTTRSPAPDVVQEKTTAYITAGFTDKDANPVIPETACYSILDADSRVVIRSRTYMPTATEIVITLTPTDNTLVDAISNAEVRMVTIETTYRDGSHDNKDVRYELVRMPAADL